jgi:acylglycerol lipase
MAHAFPVPMLLMQGDADEIVSMVATERLARSVLAHLLTYRIWKGLYHELHNETEREQVLQTIQEWLDERSKD